MATKPLSETHPALAAEWHPTLNGDLTPDKVPVAFKEKVWWLGACGHEWETLIKFRAYDNQGCAVCAGKVILAGFNDLESKNPELALEWHPTKNGDKTPAMYSKGSGVKVWWLGKCGHEWFAEIKKRGYGRGCPICAGKVVIREINSLSSTEPEIAKQWHPTKNGDKTPDNITSGSGKRVWWLGNCGHEWESTPHDRKIGYDCPFCSGKYVLLGFNDLATTHPNLVEEWHPTKNTRYSIYEVSQGSHEPVWWLGACGHEWETDLSSRTSKQSTGCPFCSGSQVLKGFNSLEDKNPDLAAEWHPTKNGTLTPSSRTAGSKEPVWWLGKCGHEWRSQIVSRNMDRGCPKCSQGGFRSTDSATLYYLHNPKLEAFKVGITNKDKKVDRLEVFKKQGWLVLKRWESESGLLILDCETQFFRWLRRDQKIPVYLDKTDRSLSGTGGASETFSDSILTPAQVIAKIEELLNQALKS